MGLKNSMLMGGLSSYGSEQGPAANPYDHNNKPSGFHEMWRISWLAEQLFAFKDGVC
jgi:hypothetical protein